jgi:hypothetical protein
LYYLHITLSQFVVSRLLFCFIVAEPWPLFKVVPSTINLQKNYKIQKKQNKKKKKEKFYYNNGTGY